MFETKLEVRYYETDMQGVVHHSNYLRWFEVIRTKLLENLGLTMVDIENQGIYYVMKEAKVDYIKPVRYGEPVVLAAKLVKYNGIRLVHQYEVRVNDEIRARGETTLVTVKKDTMAPANFGKVNAEMNQTIAASVEI